MSEIEILALLRQARHALMNPVDEDTLRSWENVEAVEAIDHALNRMPASKFSQPRP